ncbi:MAG: hypothetical protein GX962_00965 [Epulopiscium sp.]|nr:hypothetical protein [Candidatus Epulonipiscium sp.]
MKYDMDIIGLKLAQLQFDTIVASDVEDKKEANLNFEITLELKEYDDGVYPVSWELSLELESLFYIKAKYDMYITYDGNQNFLDKEIIMNKVSYPILAEFSHLTSTLTKEMGAVPLIINIQELMERGNIEQK